MKLIIAPDSSNYAVKRGAEVLSVKLDGGASKFRRDIIGAAFNVEVAWRLDPSAYDYINAFYRTATARGSLPFTIDLLLDSTAYNEVTARFVPESFRLTGQRGLTYFVSAVLEVEAPINADEATDDTAIIDAYEELHT